MTVIIFNNVSSRDRENVKKKKMNRDKLTLSLDRVSLLTYNQLIKTDFNCYVVIEHQSKRTSKFSMTRVFLRIINVHRYTSSVILRLLKNKKILTKNIN